jgi:alkylhydroperoxidase family enzyme
VLASTVARARFYHLAGVGKEMAWIRMLGKDEAEGELAKLYERVAPGDAPLDHILAVHSLHPRTLADHFALYRSLMAGPGPLTRREREIVAVAVSAANDCHY